MYYSFNCPKCNEKIICEVYFRDNIVDWDEECAECSYKFTETEKLEIYSEALEDCTGTMIDRAHDYLQDR